MTKTCSRCGNKFNKLRDEVVCRDCKEATVNNRALAKNITPRERQVALQAAQGFRNKQIAANLCVSEGYIKNIMANLFRKMDVDGRTQLAIKISKTGLLGLVLTSVLFGQTVSLSGPSTVKAGQPAVLQISMLQASTSAATQGTLQLPVGWPANCIVGAQPTKSASCAVDAKGKLTYLVWGPNANVLADGVLLKVSVTPPSSTGNKTVPITLSNPLSASPSGSAVPVGVTASSLFLKSRK